MDKWLEQSLRVYPSIHKYNECSLVLIKDMKVTITKCHFTYNKFFKVFRTIKPNSGEQCGKFIYTFSGPLKKSDFQAKF